MPGNSLIVFLCLFAACFHHDVTGFKKTVFMSPVELAVHGNLAVGDIIENKLTVPLENGTLLELPLYHKAIVVNPETLEIVHYRYKDENDTTEEELQKLKALKSETTGRGTNNMVQNMLDSIVGQVQRDFRNAKSLDDIQRVKINCRGELKGGLMDMLHKYDPKNRKVYVDNLVENFGSRPCRVNNELDLKWDPLPGELIARRAKSRTGEERFEITTHNCETFANWARYGKNYTEQGERFGEVVNTAIHGFQDLCQRANDRLTHLVWIKVHNLRTQTENGGAKGAIAGAAVGGVACLLFPPSCAVVIPAAVVGVGATNAYWNFYDAKEKVLKDAPYELNAALMTYKPDLEKIVKSMVVKLKMEEIVKVDA